MLELKKTAIKDIGFSVVICDKNIADLVNLYNLAVEMGVEFAQSTMHNSWYFHKTDNMINDTEAVAVEMRNFMSALLTSKRRSLRLKVKDWLRAFFNLRIYHHAISGYSHQCNCTAGTDLFFLDPFGNIAPCNGSDSEWIMGNLKENTFAEIWNSPKADKVRQMVKSCNKDCAFIGTARFDMLRNPVRTMNWIMKNKIRLMRGKSICVDLPGDNFSPYNIENIPVIEREKNKKLVIK
jgi:MoaA/NifB/PqqE/SkfB family radical SAM enzyme